MAVNTWVPDPVWVLAVVGETLTAMGGGGPPLADRNAAKPAAQISVTLSEALADVVPAEIWTMSSAIIFELGCCGIASSIL